MFYLTIVNNIVCHSHSWLAVQYIVVICRGTKLTLYFLPDGKGTHRQCSVYAAHPSPQRTCVHGAHNLAVTKGTRINLQNIQVMLDKCVSIHTSKYSETCL